MPKITVSRSNELLVHRGSCSRILIDGEKVAELNNAESAVIEVPAGRHTIMAVLVYGKGMEEIPTGHFGSSASTQVSLDIADGEEMTFKVSALLYPYLLLAASLVAAFMVSYAFLLFTLYFGYKWYYSYTCFYTVSRSS